MPSFTCSLSILFIILVSTKGTLATTFTLVNKCDHLIWPGILGSPDLDSTGFELGPGSTWTAQAQPGWSGRFWARTGCSSDPTTGGFNCTTGDCGSNQIECNGSGADPPATLAEFTTGSVDFYDVSLVDGYNLPMVVEPVGGSGSCGPTGCVADLNRVCPNELRTGNGQACRSACEAFGNPEYCCSGAYGSPSTCQPSMYSEIFKNACPNAYSYAYDDATSTFTCGGGADYVITFCPSIASQKSYRDVSPPLTTGTSVLPPPASTPDTAVDGQPQENVPTWLPNFTINSGSSSKLLMHSSNIVISAAIVILYILEIKLNFQLFRYIY